MADLAIQNKRQQMAQIDQELALLCQRRMTLAEEIFQLKKSQKCPIVDAAQERKVYLRYSRVLTKSTTPGRLQNFVNSLIELSRNYPGLTKEIL